MLLDSIASERIYRRSYEAAWKWALNDRGANPVEGASRDAAGIERRWRRGWLGWLLDLRYEGSYKLALPPAGYPDTRISERHRSGLYRRMAVRAGHCAESRRSRWLLASESGRRVGWIYHGCVRGNHFFAGWRWNARWWRAWQIYRALERTVPRLSARARVAACTRECAYNNDEHISQFILLRDLW